MMIGSRLRLLACALALATALAGATDASAAKRKKLVGVNAIPPPSLQQLQLVRQAGARSVRVVASWRQVERFQGFRNWAPLDAVVGNAASAGLEVLPVLHDSPNWISGHPGRPPLFSPHARAAWRSFVTELAARYGPDGAFWAQRPDLPRRPVWVYQVWNEVNLRGFWGGKPKPGLYARLLKQTTKALRRGNPRAKVLLSGLIPYKTIGAGNVGGPAYLRKLLKRKWVRKYFNSAAVHPYGASPKAVMRGLVQTREALDKFGARKKPLWVTEFGWTTGGALWDSSPVRASLRGQARKLSKTYKLMKKGAKRLKLKRAYYFNVADVDPPGTDYWSARMGLFDLNGDPKPAWFAFARRAGGQP